MMFSPILFGLASFFALWGLYNLLGYRAAKKEWKHRAEEWFDTEKRKSFILVLGDKFDQTSYGKEVQQKLIQVNIHLTSSEFYGLLLLGAVSSALLINNFVGIGYPYNIIIGFIAMWVVKRILFYVRRNKYQDMFGEQLSEVCRLLGNATRAGMTLNQGFEIVAKELSYPANREFKRLTHELRLGIDFDRALLDLQSRIHSREFKLFIANLIIQKRTGGNIHAVLNEMSTTLEERKILNQTIKTMTAEQKYIAYILPFMPIFLILLMNKIQEGFIDPLFSWIGVILIAIFVVGTVLAFVLIKKVTNIRV